MKLKRPPANNYYEAVGLINVLLWGEGLGFKNWLSVA